MVSLGCSSDSSVSHWLPFLALILCDNAEPCISQVLYRTPAAPMCWWYEKYVVDCERYLVGMALQKIKFRLLKCISTYI